MKLLAALIFLVYIVLATLSAPMLHFGTTITTHELSGSANMDAHNLNKIKDNMSDMASRCIQVATFFTTAIPSYFIQYAKLILVFLVLVGSAVLGFGKITPNLIKRWKLAALNRSYCIAVLYLAIRLFRKWLTLLKLNPNFIAAASG